MHFLEIIKLQFEKECHTLLCILKLFRNIIHQLSLKNTWLPPIFFLHFKNSAMAQKQKVLVFRDQCTLKTFDGTVMHYVNETKKGTK